MESACCSAAGKREGAYIKLYDDACMIQDKKATAISRLYFWNTALLPTAIKSNPTLQTEGCAKAYHYAMNS